MTPRAFAPPWAALLPFLLTLHLLDRCATQEPIPGPQRLRAFDRIAEAAVETGFPGVSLAGAGRSGPVFSGAAGTADREQNLPMTPDALLHGASTTKVYTAAAVLRLVDLRRLSLEDRVVDRVDPDVVEGIPHVQDMTIRHLLVHTSGLYPMSRDPRFFATFVRPPGAEHDEGRHWTARQLVRLAADPSNRPQSPPSGQSASYSSLNYALLELVVEKVTEEEFPDWVQAEVFDPLDLRATFFLSADRSRPRARGYTKDSPRLRAMGLHPDYAADDQGLISSNEAQEQVDGASGILTSMPDLVRFARAVTGGELLSEESTALLLEVCDRARGQGGRMALGILRAADMPYGLTAVALGNGLGTHVVWAYQPETELTVAIGINQFGGWNEAPYILQTLIPECLEATAAAVAESGR